MSPGDTDSSLPGSDDEEMEYAMDNDTDSSMSLDENEPTPAMENIRRYMTGLTKPCFSLDRAYSPKKTSINNIKASLKHFPLVRKRGYSSHSNYEHDCLLPPRKRMAVLEKVSTDSHLDVLPQEIIEKIAIEVPTDQDLRNLTSTSYKLAQSIIPQGCKVWKERFLARYDYPIVQSCEEFRPAYALRRCVLGNFIGFEQGLSRRGLIQLEAIRDMILETYHEPRYGHVSPTTSRNLRLFASPQNSKWMATFLASRYVSTENQKWGEPNSIFETISLVLSHVVLSPKSALAYEVAASRNDYNLVQVYNFNQRLTTIYRQRQKPQQCSEIATQKCSTRLAAKHDRTASFFQLDTNLLLHIRNYWHHQLIDNVSNYNTNVLARANDHRTYAQMMNRLSALDMVAREWDRPLQKDVPLATKWCGQYSSLAPWPPNRKALEEQQNLAETWDMVDPMALNLCVSQDYNDGYWPIAFSSIPAFAKTTSIPALLDDDLADRIGILEDNMTQLGKKGSRKDGLPTSPDQRLAYIRGIAPFLDLNATDMTKKGLNSSGTSSRHPVECFTRNHPFLALRVRGVVHPIDPRSTISPTDIPSTDNSSQQTDYSVPGWRRICMVIWRPSKRYLLSVLEHANGDFGGSFEVGISNSIQAQVSNTASIWNTGGPASAPATSDSDNPTNTHSDSPASTPPQPAQSSVPSSTQTESPQSTTTTTQNPTNNLHSIIETHLDRALREKLTRYSLDHPDITFTAANIAKLEDSFSPAHFLDWTEGYIEDAYAYEGAILPGGKIMMGRFWRYHGTHGLGVGKEIGADGHGVTFDDEGIPRDTEDVDDETGLADANQDGTMDGGGDDGMDTAKNGVGEEGGDGHEEDGVLPDQESEGTAASGERRTSTRHRTLDRGPFIFWC